MVDGGPGLKGREDELSIQILRLLPQLEEERPGIKQFLATQAFIRSAGDEYGITYVQH